MSLNSQFSLALELSNVFPIRSLVDSGVNRVLRFARDLRKSGSDIVVEEDLAAVFGRAAINPDIEDEFKRAVRVQTFIPLSHDSEIRLDSGPGPTMQRALKERRYVATFMQLSLLAWMQSRGNLARILAECMKKRAEKGVHDASNPGSEGIAITLSACSSQTSNFTWSFYVREVETRLRSSFPDYQFHQEYTNMPENVLLGAMDYLYLVQSLPDQRKVIVSNQAGFITLVVWAHYLLSLTVTILNAKSPQKSIVFQGSSEDAQITILWQECEDHSNDHNSNYVTFCRMRQTEIRLLDSDTSVTLQLISSQESSQIVAIHQDRHPLLGYGSTSLHRMLNSTSITPETDPIYEDSVKLITALAIHTSGRLCRKFDPEWREESRYRSLPRHDIEIEIWRVLAAAKVVFSGIKQNAGGVASYVEFLAASGLNETSIPLNFQNHIKKARQRGTSLPHEKTFLNHISYLARVVLLFSCVVDVESCAEMPIILHRIFTEMELEVISACRNPRGHPMVAPEAIFFGLVQLLSNDTLQVHSHTNLLNEDAHLLFLCSDFGWSVFLDTTGDKDPEDVRPHLIHIKRGVPTDARTNERKLQISDGPGPQIQQHRVYRVPPEEKATTIPRTVAQVTSRREYWTTLPQRFEMSLIFKVEPTKTSILHQFDIQALEDWTYCRAMHGQIWETYVTPTCGHQPEPEPKAALKLAPDAIALMGWSNGGEASGSGPYPQRVVVFLTRGDSRVRWLAVKNALETGPSEPCDRREVMLRTRSCCDECALKHVFSLPGRWTLIL